jgi:hypothetical protein
MLLYLLPETFGMMIAGMLYEMIKAKSVSKAIARFFIYLLLLGLTLFLVLFPVSFILFFNSTEMPELNLFHSETADLILNYLNTEGSLLALIAMPFKVFKVSALMITAGSIILLMMKKFKEGSMFQGEGRVPFELKYVTFLTLGFVIGFLPAFLIGLMIEGSFPFVLLIVMRLYCEYMMTPKDHTILEES